MWIYIVFQGLVGCAVLLWFAADSWPTHAAELLAVPFPALLIFAGVTMHRRELRLAHQRKAYLESNEAARRELNRAQVFKWASLAVVLLVMVLIARALPPKYEGSPTLVWMVGGALVAASFIPTLYSSLVKSKVEEAAQRQYAGQPPLTREAQRKRTIWFVAPLAVIAGIIAFEQFVPSPISAMTVFVYGALIFAGVAFIWRKLYPPRDPK